MLGANLDGVPNEGSTRVAPVEVPANGDFQVVAPAFGTIQQAEMGCIGPGGPSRQQRTFAIRPTRSSLRV